MPEVEGLQLIQELLRLNRSQRIIAMSAGHRAETIWLPPNCWGRKPRSQNLCPRKSCCGPSTRSRIGKTACSRWTLPE